MYTKCWKYEKVKSFISGKSSNFENINLVENVRIVSDDKKWQVSLGIILVIL